MPRQKGARIQSVETGSIAGVGGLAPGDRIVAINGEAVSDELDLLFCEADDRIEVLYITPEGEQKTLRLQKPYEASLGVLIEPMETHRCKNRCVFCFIEQNPPGLRKPLYLKDEDFRLSFTHGHYITASSLRQSDLERIIRQRLSPLYLSIHATDHDLRCHMLGRKPEETRPILDVLDALRQAEIDFHGQVVLCPGWNDGPCLEDTLDALEDYIPHLLSLAIVPVGLTDHRSGLEPLEPVTPATAHRVIDSVFPRQERLRAEHGERIILMADEFYLYAKKPLPVYGVEERYHQIENGVGMVQDFFEGWGQMAQALPTALARPKKVGIFTGLLGARVLARMVDALQGITGLEIALYAIENSLYGKSVTVSGLLPGRDFQRALAQAGDLDLALLPPNALRAEGDLFLDDLALESLREQFPDTSIQVPEGGACAILDAIQNT